MGQVHSRVATQSLRIPEYFCDRFEIKDADKNYERTFSEIVNSMNLASKYALESEDEKFLQELNGQLQGQHVESLVPDLEERFASLHVVGVPRSGTTLLTQLIASELNVGYINNLAAAFWLAPVYGIRLAKKLLPKNYESNFRSEFGRTDNILEPHEFGRFWNHLLGHDDLSEPDPNHEAQIDWQHVRTVLNNMAEASGGPMVFKSFLLSWYVPKFVEVMTKSLFIWVCRDPLENALSLLSTRRQYANSEDHWVGLRPQECKRTDGLSVHLQVASQVYYLEKSIESRLVSVSKDRWLKIRYEDVCRDPGAELDRICQAAQRLGSSVKSAERQLSAQAMSLPSQRMPREDVRQIEAAFRTLESNG